MGWGMPDEYLGSRGRGGSCVAHVWSGTRLSAQWGGVAREGDAGEPTASSAPAASAEVNSEKGHVNQVQGVTGASSAPSPGPAHLPMPPPAPAAASIIAHLPGRALAAATGGVPSAPVQVDGSLPRLPPSAASGLLSYLNLGIPQAGPPHVPLKLDLSIAPGSSLVVAGSGGAHLDKGPIITQPPHSASSKGLLAAAESLAAAATATEKQKSLARLLAAAMNSSAHTSHPVTKHIPGLGGALLAGGASAAATPPSLSLSTPPGLAAFSAPSLREVQLPHLSAAVAVPAPPYHLAPPRELLGVVEPTSASEPIATSFPLLVPPAVVDEAPTLLPVEPVEPSPGSPSAFFA